MTTPSQSTPPRKVPKWFWPIILILLVLLLIISRTSASLFFLVPLIQITTVTIAGWTLGITGGVIIGILLGVTVTFFGQPPPELFNARPSFMPFGGFNIIINTVAGAFVGFISNNLRQVRHLSEQLMQEREELQQERSQLQQEVSQRQQIEIELQKALLKAEDASKAKSAFLANMSHELRTPLTAMIGYNELLLDLDNNEKSHRYLHKALFAARHLQTVINDILDLSRIEAGQLNIKHTPYSLDTSFINILDMMVVKAEEKGLYLHYTVAANTPTQLIGDEVHLQQILINLLGNAIKFTEKGGITLSVKTEPLKTPSHYLYHFTVSDTGIGIPAEAQANIFDTFIQADNSSTRRYDGTGLGLAISKRLVQAMNGVIQVQSELNKGSHFNFAIPIKVKSPTPTMQTDGTISHKLSTP